MGRRITKKKQVKRVTTGRNRKSSKRTSRVSEKVYKKLLNKSKRSLTKNEKKKLDKALHQRYCSCLKALESNKKYNKGAAFGICGTSIYLNRGYSIPKNAARSCRK